MDSSHPRDQGALAEEEGWDGHIGPGLLGEAYDVEGGYQPPITKEQAERLSELVLEKGARKVTLDLKQLSVSELKGLLVALELAEEHARALAEAD